MAHGEAAPGNFNIDRAFGTLVMAASVIMGIEVFLGLDN